MHRILVINPGSTSTKIAVYEDLNQVFESDIRHTSEELSHFNSVWEQEPFRRQVVIDELNKHNIPMHLDAVVGRGSLAKAVPSGTYEVTEQMVAEARNAKHVHACDIGCALALDIANLVKPCRAFTSDPGSVDETTPAAHLCGFPEIRRTPIWHALNQKAIARRYAREHGTRYEDLNLIICHLGGGISIAAHDHGVAVDANNALDGDGPFSPERSGSVPVGSLVHMCFSGKYTEKEMMNRIAGNGGMKAFLGTNDMRQVEARIAAGDEKAKLVADAMLLQTARWIAADGAVLCGKVDAIILTGGMAYSKFVVDELKRRISYLAPVEVYPGQEEMLAMAQNALRELGAGKEQ